MPTQIREIRYRGFSTAPDDYAVPDGELEGVTGLVHEDEALKPIQPPTSLFDLPQGKTIDYIHLTPAFRHYILRDTETGQLSYTKDGGTFAPLESVGKEIYDIKSIGNTLLVLTPTGMHYFLYKDSTQGYLHLGTQIPFPQISFSISDYLKHSTNISISNIRDTDDRIMEWLNPKVANTYKEGRFCFPFLIRYALRLYDGTTTMPSPPIYMEVYNATFRLTDNFNPDVYFEYADYTLSYQEVDTPEDLALLLHWKDIVKSVDIFISRPIYTWRQDGKGNEGSIVPGMEDHDYSDYDDDPRNHDDGYIGERPPQPEFDRSTRYWRNTEHFDKELIATSSFYLLESIPLEKLTQEETKIIKKDYLPNLPSYETLTDNPSSHHRLIPSSAYVYNSRLNLTGLSEALFPQANRFLLLEEDRRLTSSKEAFFYVFLKGDDGEDLIFDLGRHSAFLEITLLFFPDPRAYKLIILNKERLKNGESRTWKCERKMKKHDFLSASYVDHIHKEQWEQISENTFMDLWGQFASAPAHRTFSLPNKVYTSEINNPFSFPTRGVNSIGTGKVLGISAATKALSAGQFGQFPLYALSTDGVWALEVAKDGTYTAKQPISRDVCINPKSITQIDNAVLFTSERGIMMLSGSQCVCISDSLDPNKSISLKGLPKSDLITKETGISTEQTEHLPLKDFLLGAEMIYDYPRQRLYAYNPKTSYTYVYSLKSKQWSTTETNIRKAVNSYPQTIAVTKDGKVVDYSKIDPTKRITNRYLVVVDIGGRSRGADDSVICVFDRLFMIDGGKPVVVAQWYGHIDMDKLAWKAAQIAKYYDDALLVIESNTLETKDPNRQVDGDHSHFILNQIKDVYDRLYARPQSADEIRDSIPRKYGFHTNVHTKPIIIDVLITFIREGLYVERDERCLNEYITYERKQNGAYGAILGKHDDLLMTRAIGLYISSNTKEMPLPKIIPIKTPEQRRSSRRMKPVNEATI